MLKARPAVEQRGVVGWWLSFTTATAWGACLKAASSDARDTNGSDPAATYQHKASSEKSWLLCAGKLCSVPERKCARFRHQMLRVMSCRDWIAPRTGLSPLLMWQGNLQEASGRAALARSSSPSLMAVSMGEQLILVAPMDHVVRPSARRLPVGLLP